MKKMISVFGLVLLLSCSTNDVAPTSYNTNGIRLKKRTLALNGVTYASDYTYDGNHLAKISSGSGYSIFSYIGERIVRIDNYTPENTPEGTTSCQYNSSNQLTLLKSVYYADNTGYKAIYQYNPDNSVTVNTYTGDNNSQDIIDPETTKLYFENNEIVKKEITSLVSGTLVTDTYTYTYDGKNNPNKNMVGYQKIMFYQKYFGPSIIDNLQNIQTITTSLGNSTQSSSYTYQYTYNAVDYPISSQRMDSGGNLVDGIASYFYE